MARTKQKARESQKLSHSKNLKGDMKSVKELKNKGGGIKRPHKFKPGTVALREIRKYQKSTDHLIPKAPFTRLVRQKISDHATDMKLSKGALEMLREDGEQHLTRYFENALLQTLHAKRVTVQSKDMRLTGFLMEDK